MDQPSELLSPKQASRAIGVSESSLKRWCDQGLIKTVRTVGGHRKLLRADVLRFVLEQDRPLVSPATLGLPPFTQRAEQSLAHYRPRMVDALLIGDELLARQMVFDLYLAKHSISVICDEVIAAAFREIGERWACRQAAVYQERRGCEIGLRVLFEIRKILRAAAVPFSAIGGTMEGDLYSLPTAMAELVLCECGFRAISLGTSIPIDALIEAVQETKPTLFWLSVSHIREGLDFIGEFAKLSDACMGAGTALVVGGRALTADLRQRMIYSGYCDTMQHLERFAKTLARSLHVEPNTKKVVPSHRTSGKTIHSDKVDR